MVRWRSSPGPILHSFSLQDANLKLQLRKWEVTRFNQVLFASCLRLDIPISELRFFGGVKWARDCLLPKSEQKICGPKGIFHSGPGKVALIELTLKGKSEDKIKVWPSLLHALCLIEGYCSPCMWPEAQQPPFKGDSYLFLSLTHCPGFLVALGSSLWFWVLWLSPFLTLQPLPFKEKFPLSSISSKHHPPKAVVRSSLLMVSATTANNLKLTIINPYSYKPVGQ